MEPVSILVDQIMDIARSAVALLPKLLISLAILIITYGLAKLAKHTVKSILHRTTLRKSLVELLVLFASLTTWLVGIMISAIIAFPGAYPHKDACRAGHRVCCDWLCV